MISSVNLALGLAVVASTVRASLWPSAPWLQRRAEEKAARFIAEEIIWVPTDVYEGDNFFEQFDFFSDKDPTNGEVNYLPRESAMNSSQPLAYLDNGQAVIRVDNWTWLDAGQYRNSVRLESKKTYDGGLFLMDVAHSPTGCAVWPAYWTLGRADNWPNAGEIDIIEGVHNNQRDQITWHTAPGCNLTAPGNFTGTAINTNCHANEVGGCGIVDWSQSSFGSAFNSFGGGVYAMRWDEDSIDVWFFYRATVPIDVQQGRPNPSYANWGLPSASISNKGCDIKKYFKAHAIIINITLCGDWAGNTFQADGCEGSCSDRIRDPANMNNATWVVNSLRVFEKRTLQGRTDGTVLDLLPSRDTALVTAAAAALLAL